MLWDRIVVLAAETIPLLPAQEAEAMWRRLAEGACAARLPERERRWLALFVATAARDAPAMRRAAEPLLGDDGNTPAQWQYVVAAAGAGAMAMHDAGAVGRLLRDYGPRLPPQARQTGWFALLSAVSGQPVPEAPR